MNQTGTQMSTLKDDFGALIGFEPISLMHNIFPIKL